MVNLLFNPQGRIQAGPFWQGVIILLVVSFVLSVLQVYLLPVSAGLLVGLLSLALLYPMVCVYVKRFHDSGRSGWWVLLVFAIQIVLGGAIIAGLSASMVMGDLAGLQDMQPGTPEYQSFQADLQRQLFLPSQVVSVVLSLGVAFFVARLKSDPAENRFGPPPGATGQAGAL